MYKAFDKKEGGSGLIEAVVGIALVLAIMLSATQLYVRAASVAQQNVATVKQVYLLQESAEGIRSVRDRGWSNISSLLTTETYHLLFDVTAEEWRATTTAQTIDGVYTRTFTVADVNRDTDDDIVETGGSNDADTKKITTDVTWQTTSGTSTRELSFYIFNTFGT